MKARLRDKTWLQEHDQDVVLYSRALAFYPGYRLVMATCRHWKPEATALFWLVGGDDIYRLNGVSPPIHDANAQSNQRLTADTAIDYLNFFCFFVRGEEGPFVVIESLGSPFLPSSMKAENAPGDSAGLEHRLLARLHQSVRYHGTDGDGKFRLSATVFYSNAIFLADFLVQPGGMIEMLGDMPVMADLPYKVDAPLTLSREFQPEAS